MPYDFKAKQGNVKQLNNYMLAKTLSMFEYENLPDSIPQRELEKILQTSGVAFIAKAPDGELYAFTGSQGGVTDAYGNSTTFTISNVYLNYNATLNIKKEGVLFRNDDMGLGLIPFYEKQNTLLVENDINMVIWGYNSRQQKLISAPDDKTKESADLYIKRLIDGDLSAIGENALFDGVKVQPSNTGSGNGVQQMIEYNQYIKSCLYNEVGLPSNFNMKKERLISSEIDQAEDSLFSLVYNMMENRLKAVAAINEMYGTDIKVGFGSVWALKNKKLVDGVIDNNDLPDATNTNNGNGDGGEGSTTDADLNVDENKGVDDEQGQQKPDNQDSGDDSGNDSESQKTVDELQAIIDSDDSSDEDKQAAKDLLAEINKGE